MMKAPHGGRPPVWIAKAEFWRIIRFMKQQIANRLGVAHVRDTVMQLVAGSITREQAMESLEIGKTRLYELKASYLAARAKGLDGQWMPGRSGGDHAAPWPDEEQRFLKRVLSPDGGSQTFLVRVCGK